MARLPGVVCYGRRACLMKTLIGFRRDRREAVLLFHFAQLHACPLLAQSGHAELHCTCPLLGVKRTSLVAPHMSAFGVRADMASPKANIRRTG